MPSNDFFTAVGATAKPIEDAVTVPRVMSAIWRYLRVGRDEEHPDFIARYGNPGEIPGNFGDPDKHSYGWFDAITQAKRLEQANTFLTHANARSSKLASMLQGIQMSVWQSSSIRAEILAAPNQTRADYLKVVAPKYDLDPELLGAIILTEQRDASEAGDVIEYIAGYHRGRMKTSIGLGQVRGLTHNLYDLLDGVFSEAMFSPWRFPPTFIFRLLADDALSMHATAKYIRLLANQGAEIQEQEKATNSMHDTDPSCKPPADGKYVNQALRDLSVLEKHTSNWTTLPDDTLPETPPSNLTAKSDGSPVAPPWQESWDIRWRGQYYVRLIGGQYTSCPFDPYTLSLGITLFAEDPPGSGQWVFDDILMGAISGWGFWVSDSFDDMRRSPHL